MKKILYLILTTASFGLFDKAAEASIKPSALLTVKKSNEKYEKICQALNGICDDKEKIWQVKNSSNIYYLTKKPLKLIKVEKIDNEKIKIAEWDFATEYSTTTNHDQIAPLEDMYIYPALYPLSKHEVAVAIISKKEISNPAGTREDEYADFFMINDDSTYDKAFKNIPFYSHKMVKTCFSEEDYANSEHCHDENWCILNLKFIDEGESFYKWRFIEKTHIFPAIKKDFSTDVKTHERILSPFKIQTADE